MSASHAEILAGLYDTQGLVRVPCALGICPDGSSEFYYKFLPVDEDVDERPESPPAWVPTLP